MGRYTGPTERLSRREGVELFLKGERCLAGKSGLERRGASPPGEHGKRRQQRSSIYGAQLREKQRVKRYYGVREKQFRRYVKEAARRREGRTGEQLLILLEQRLDNVIYRLGLATTRAQARQFVNHGHVDVNGRRVDIPSFKASPGDRIEVRTGSPIRSAAREATETVSAIPRWLEADFDVLSGRVLRLPARTEISVPADEQLIVEFYSRR
ncbi:MAG: 30S ribosomal protein S4 [Solirubrobacteraceae bacterium]|nr:30S ribosomal protein S4 [Solirubrobacteraceae bacterium]